MESNPGMKLGWSPLHEACFVANKPVVIKLLNYSKESGKNLIELETSDEYKTTPLIVAALGGQIEIVDLLISYGANINATIQVQTNLINLEITGVAAIRNDIDLLTYLYKRCPNTCNNLRRLMISDKIDTESRHACSKTLELISNDYKSLKTFKLAKYFSKMTIGTVNMKYKSLEARQRMAADLITHNDFGKCMAQFLELSSEYDCMATFVNIFRNVIDDDVIRKNFCDNGGVAFLIKYIDKQNAALNQKINTELKVSKVVNSVQFLQLINKKIHYKERENSSNNIELSKVSQNIDEHNMNKTHEEDLADDLRCICIGNILEILSSHEDSLNFMNNLEYNYKEHIIGYIHTIFEWNKVKKGTRRFSQELRTDLTRPVYIGEYITSFIICIGNLCFKNKVSKRCFAQLNMMEHLLSLWNQLNEINCHLNYNKMHDIFDQISVELFNKLRLEIVGALGKILNRNDQLKQIYLYSYKEDMAEKTTCKEVTSADWFLRELISWLEEPFQSNRKFQYESLKFIKLITDGDSTMQNILIPHNVVQSQFVRCMKSLLKKNSPRNMRYTTLIIIWTLSGEKNEFKEFHDRKCAIYKLFDPEVLLDLFLDSDDTIVTICLEVILSILTAASSRNIETNEIINEQDKLAEIHLIPILLRLLKTSNLDKEIEYMALNVIECLCISYGLKTNSNNQLLLLKYDGLAILLDLLKRPNENDVTKSLLYYTLSILCYKNTKIIDELFAAIDPVQAIKELNELLVTSSPLKTDGKKDFGILKEDIDGINTQITAGVALCIFYQSSENFKKDMTECMTRIDWSVYQFMLDKQDFLINKALYINDKRSGFTIKRLKCLLSFQVSILNNFIINSTEDPRAIGIKILTDYLASCLNSYLRSIICDYIGRMIIIEPSLYDPFICMQVVEALAESMFDSGTMLRGDTEKGCAAITLGLLNHSTVAEIKIDYVNLQPACFLDEIQISLQIPTDYRFDVPLQHISRWTHYIHPFLKIIDDNRYFTNHSAEARRRFFKVARKNDNVMKLLKYSNKIVHPDLIFEWNHFKALNDSIKKEFKFTKPLNRTFKT